MIVLMIGIGQSVFAMDNETLANYTKNSLVEKSEIDSSIILQGTFAMLDSMLPDGNHQKPTYFLIPENTQEMYQLRFSIPPDDPQSISGKKIIIQGNLVSTTRSLVNQQEIKTIDVHIIHKISSEQENNVSRSNISSRSLTGSENIQTLLVKYPDVVNEAHSSAYFADRFYTAADSLNNYYKTSSYNQFSITGTANGWKTLPENKSAYQFEGGIDWYKLIQDAIQVNKATVDFSTVDGIIIVTNDCSDIACAAYGYLAKFGWDGGPDVGIINITVSLLPDVSESWCCGYTYSKGLYVAAHELGHNLTFEHTPPPPGDWTSIGYGDAYHDPWSVMSAPSDYESPPGLIMGLRDSIGWVNAENKITIPLGSSNTITLDNSNEAQSGINPQMAIVPLPDGTKYILEARKDGLFDDTPLDNEGIVIYKYFPNGNQYSYLTFYPPDKYAKYSLVATSGTSTLTDFVTANLDVEESWSDSNQVTVMTLSKTNTSTTVFVSNAGPLPPSKITDLTATSGNTKATLSWTVPNIGGSAITDYIIQYKKSTSALYTIFPDVVSATAGGVVTGLTNELLYDFKVSAVNAAGTGLASNVVSAIPNVICSPPTVPWVITSSCRITGNVEPPGNVNVQNGVVVTIESGGTLHINSGVTLTNSGTINNYGTIINSGGTIVISNTDEQGISNQGTISNSGTINISNLGNSSTGIYNSGSFLNSGTVNISNINGRGIWGDNPALFNNSGGTITISNNGGIGIYWESDTLQNASDGIIIIENSNGSGIGFNDAGMANSGTIIISNPDGIGIDIIDETGLVNNSGGLIQITNSGGSGIKIHNNGYFRNTGNLTISNIGGTGIHIDSNVNVYDLPGIVDNFGLISIFGTINNLGTLNNSGTINVQCGATYFGNSPSGNSIFIICACIPTVSEVWIINSSCQLSSNASVGGNVIVQNNSVLVIPSGKTLDINFATKHLLIKSGSKVVIISGGKIN